MKTDPKNKNAFRAPSHPEQSTDTNIKRRYEVTIHRTDYCYAKLEVEAMSEQQAEQMAKKLEADCGESIWQVADRERYVYLVQPVVDGKESC